jgi:hypothetical protein
LTDALRLEEEGALARIVAGLPVLGFEVRMRRLLLMALLTIPALPRVVSLTSAPAVQFGQPDAVGDGDDSGGGSDDSSSSSSSDSEPTTHGFLDPDTPASGGGSSDDGSGG